MGKVFFPLDEELELLPGNLAPRQQEHLVHLACFMPFDKVAQMMEELLSVQTNEETVRRLTEQVGSWMEAAQAECPWRGSKAIGPNSTVRIAVANELIGSGLRGSPPVFLLPKGPTKKLVVSRDTSRFSVLLNHS